MILLRVANYWRICGVLHSDLKYMDDELRAKPTPDQNPFLGRKINMLYQLLTNQTSPKSTLENAAAKNTNSETENDTFPTCTLPNLSELNGLDAEQQQCKLAKDSSGTRRSNMNDDKLFFENTSMRLSLPIPVNSTERLLMINVGDDFTHLWFPTWHKFLSLKRIQSSLHLSKELGKAIEMSQSNNNPKVFVTSSHDNVIFIGPYGSNDRQNVFLFVKYDNHIMLSEKYYKEFGSTFTRKTKGTFENSPKRHYFLTVFFFKFLFSFMDISVISKARNLHRNEPVVGKSSLTENRSSVFKA